MFELDIYCPNCHNRIGRKNLDEKALNLYCDNCNLEFIIDVLDFNENKNRPHDDIHLNLQVYITDNRIWKKTNQNLLPVYSCIFCERVSELKGSYDIDKLTTCDKCGAQYRIENIVDIDDKE